MAKSKSITPSATTKPKSMRSVMACSSKESLENEFKKRKLSKKQSISLLTRAMGISAISYSEGYPSIEERYKAVIGTYLSGVWKRSYSSWNQGES